MTVVTTLVFGVFEGIYIEVTMLAASEIQNMSLAERLQAMEMLWASLASSPEQVASPDWHGTVIAERIAEYKSGKAESFSLEELKERLRKKSG